MKNLCKVCLVFLILFSGCDSDNNKPAIDFELNREIQEINRFIEKNPFTFEKEYNDPTHGVRVFWTEVSGTGKKPNFGDTLVIDYVAKRFDMPNWVLDTSIQSVAENWGFLFSESHVFGPVKYIFGSTFGKLADGFEIVFPIVEEGDKVTVFFPSRYANKNPAYTRIPGNAIIIFELELLEIRDAMIED